jgi:hypothetical protein
LAYNRIAQKFQTLVVQATIFIGPGRMGEGNGEDLSRDLNPQRFH